MRSGEGIGVARLAGKRIRNPVLEFLSSVAGVAVDTAALEQVDRDFVDKVDVAAELESVAPIHLVEHIGDLVPVLVRLCDTGQGIRHTVGFGAQTDAWPGRIGSGSFKIATPLETHIVDHRIGERRCPVSDEEALVVTGGRVGAGRGVGVRGVGGIAVGLIEISEIEVRVEQVFRI